MLRRLAAPVALLAASSAGCRAPTQVTVEVTTDVPCDRGLDSRVTVGTLGVDLEARPPVVDSITCDAAGRVGALVVVPSGGRDSEFAVKVWTTFRPTSEMPPPSADACAVAGNGPGCIVARRALHFLPHTPLTLPIAMRSDCEDVACAPTETCVHHRCVSATIDPVACAADACSDESLWPGATYDGGADGSDGRGDAEETPESSIDGREDDADTSVDATVDAIVDASVEASDASSDATDGSDDDVDTACEVGTFVCKGTTRSVCTGDGGHDDEDCAPGLCHPVLGCVVCDPDAPGTCSGGVSTRCKADGSGWFQQTCDPLQGSACDATSGACTGPCAPDALGTSYIGCDYYPTVTATTVLSQFHFAVTVSNPGASPATVTISRGASTITSAMVAGGSVRSVTLPWIPTLKHATLQGGSQWEEAPDPGGSVLATQGAYRLRSTQPVTVYQFNPIEYVIGSDYAYSSDASLLLPTNAWGRRYRVASRPAWNPSVSVPAFYAVVAAQDGTRVTVTPPPSGRGAVRTGIPGLDATGGGTFTLNAGDVAEVFSHADAAGAPAPSDPTGALVEADAPIQVLAGAQCVEIPDGVAACDHLEESMFPAEALGQDYFVTAPAIPTTGKPKVEMVRVVAVNGPTTLTYEPPQPGAPTTLAAAGDFVELALTDADFRVTATDRVLVAQYMTGQQQGGDAGDPAMSLVVGTSAYRRSYLFHAPTSYAQSYVNVVAPVGAAVTLDGTVLTGFAAIGSSGYAVARVALSNAGSGNHTIDGGGSAIGISVYGYGKYTSYWYPGGLDLGAP